MSPGKFRELTDRLADAISEIRAHAAGDPATTLAIIDHVLRDCTWAPRPDAVERETRTDAKGSAGTLALRVSLEVRK